MQQKDPSSNNVTLTFYFKGVTNGRDCKQVFFVDMKKQCIIDYEFNYNANEHTFK